MDKSFDLIVVGELNPDLILSGDVELAFGQVEELVTDATLTVGSSSAIFACGAARLGLKVAFIGKVGHDEFGRFMVHALQEYGIDMSGVIEDTKVKTGLSVILSHGSDRAILTYPGTIGLLRFSEVNVELLTQARHLHLASYFLQEKLRPNVPDLFDLAHHHGMTISLDTNYDPAEKWEGLVEVLPRTDVYLPNVTEACAITGVSNIDVAMGKLSQQVKIVAVKCGAQGAVARKGEEVVRAASIPVHVVDTVGAGDSFDAGFIYGYLNGWDLRKTLRMAAVCGSLSTRAAGGTAAQPTLAEALANL